MTKTVSHDAKQPDKRQPGEARRLPPGVSYDAKYGKYRWFYQRQGKRKNSGYFTTAREAANDRARVILELEKGTHIAPDKTTVESYLATYLERKTLRLAKKTAHGYLWCTKQYIVPDIGKLKLQELKPPLVAAFYERLEKRGLSHSTRRQVHAILHGALKEAMAFDILHRNPCDAVKPAPSRVQEVRKAQAWEPEELAAFMLVARDDYPGAVLLFMAATGLRRGEACGLRWQDVDLLGRRLHVRQNRVTVGGRAETSTPKTQSSARSLLLSDDTVQFLLAHQHRQRELRGMQDAKWRETGYVFTTSIGTPFHPDNLVRPMVRLCAAAGVPRIRLHDLRHTHASLMLRAGAPLEVVSKRLGHSRASFTADVYRHVYDSEQDAWALDLSDMTAASPAARKRSA